MTKTALPISKLSEKNTRLLAISALFENDFSLDWIVDLMGSSPLETLTSLEELSKSGWLKRKQPGIYSLSRGKNRLQDHPLSREEQNAYNKRIATILLAMDRDEVDKSKVVSHHLLRIENDIVGCRWLKRAGDVYLQDHDARKSLKCYLKVINDLNSLHEDEESVVLFLETIHQYIKISLATQNTADIQSILQSALRKAIKFNKPEYQALIKMDIAKGEWLRSRYDDAMKYFEEGSEIAIRLQDPRLTDKLNKFFIFFYYWQGRHRDVIKRYETVLPDITRFPEGRFPLLGVMTAGISYVHTGQLATGLGLMDAFRRHCQEIGDRYMESSAIAGIGLIMLIIQREKEALPHFELARDMCTEEGNHYMAILSRLGLALCYHLQNENERAILYLREFLDLSSQFQITGWPHPFFLELCWLIEQGKFPAVQGVSLREEINRQSHTKSVFLQGLAYRYQALLDRRMGLGGKKVMHSLKLALVHLEEAGSVIEMSKTQLEIARQQLLEGKEADARETMFLASKVLAPLNEGLIPDDLKFLLNQEEPNERIFLKEILSLGQEIVNIRENKDLVQKIITSATRLTGAERGAIFMLNGEKLDIKASKNLSPEEIFHANFASSLKTIEEVVRTGIGHIQNVSQTEMQHLSAGELVRTVICVPLVLRGEIKGVLYHDNRLLGSTFRNSDLELLAYFAAQAAIALDNVAAYEEIQQLNAKLIEEKDYLEEQYHFSNISIDNIIGESAPFQQVMGQIQQVARMDTNVLILGETGTGKELVASAVHQHSPRRNKPLICVQCSALPEKLLPSELFGHEKGSFTGAVKRRIGRFELADKGTIFLDEIGDLQPDMQVQLLRVLETKQFERVGGTETLQSDFRLIAATNRDLEKMCEEGTFRKDLYYRLNVFPVHVPPLRERKEDIPLLVDYFVKIFARKSRKSFKRISPEDLNTLFQYDWPGNIRELENIMERAVILSKPPHLIFQGLLPSVRPDRLPEESLVLGDWERRCIIEALKRTNGKVRGPKGAAEILNINASTLYFRMKKMGIKRFPDFPK